MSRRTARAQIKTARARAREKALRRTVEGGNNNADAYPQGELASPAALPLSFHAYPQKGK